MDEAACNGALILGAIMGLLIGGLGFGFLGFMAGVWFEDRYDALKFKDRQRDK